MPPAVTQGRPPDLGLGGYVDRGWRQQLVVKPRGEGDSRFAVFHRASDGVAAACAIQIALLREPWLFEPPLRVSVAVHRVKPIPEAETFTWMHGGSRQSLEGPPKS